MNRYKTAPGLGPSKASATTTCQKCLQKGHFSYECKGALQSRPYVSRASRTQQLRNPKLKPALTETKLEESNKIPDPAEAKSSKQEDDEHTRDDSDGRDNPRPAKRQRRSASVSSEDSISTISTNASNAKSPGKEPRSRTSEAKSINRNSGLPVQRRRRSPDSRSRSPPVSKHDHEVMSRRREQSPRRSRRNAASPDTMRNSHEDKSEPRSRRERSLSPYSRRLALTQAMNIH